MYSQWPLCSSSWQGLPGNVCRKVEINTSLLPHSQSGRKQEIVATTYHLFFFFFLLYFLTSASFSVKETNIQTQTRWLFRVTSPPSSWAINFLNKVTTSGPNSSSFHVLAYCAMKRMSLDLVTVPHQQTHTCFHSIGRKQKEKLIRFDSGENVYSSKFLQWASIT